MSILTLLSGPLSALSSNFIAALRLPMKMLKSRRMEMSTPKKYYLAGPMSGIPQFNFPEFFRVGELLRNAGYDIVSPAEIDHDEDKGAALASPDGNPNNRDHMNNKTWGDFLARDVKLIADQVDGIILMPGWEKSKGAKLEAFVALLAKKEMKVLVDDAPKDVAPVEISEIIADEMWYGYNPRT